MNIEEILSRKGKDHQESLIEILYNVNQNRGGMFLEPYMILNTFLTFFIVIAHSINTIESQKHKDVALTLQMQYVQSD